jgi:hypothetical protein
MTVEETAGVVVRACTELGIPILVVGSLSSNYYGLGRSTNDADFVVQTKPGDIRALAAKLSPLLRLDPQPGIESITLTTKYLFEVRDHAFFVELFELTDDPHDQARFARRVQINLYGTTVWLPAAEDVIVQKLRWYARGKRGKDLEDVRNVIDTQQDRLDWDYIHHWCDHHGSREHLDAIRQSLANMQ